MPLADFYQVPGSGRRVIGTYIYPFCLLGEPGWDDPYGATEAIAAAKTDPGPILITRNGGLFIEPPRELSDPIGRERDGPSADDLEAKLAFQERAALALNTVLCELALLGVVSEIATPVHLSRGTMLPDSHCLITSAGGGRESYRERALGPSLSLHDGLWRTWPLHSSATADAAASLARTTTLLEVSDQVPTLVTGAYSLYSKGQVGEALIDAWGVVEQMVDYLWQRHLTTVAAGARRERLRDTRTYTAAVRIELLHSVGAIAAAEYELLSAARSARNDFAHRARLTPTGARACVDAMRRMIEAICGSAVAPPEMSRGVTW